MPRRDTMSTKSPTTATIRIVRPRPSTRGRRGRRGRSAWGRMAEDPNGDLHPAVGADRPVRDAIAERYRSYCVENRGSGPRNDRRLDGNDQAATTRVRRWVDVAGRERITLRHVSLQRIVLGVRTGCATIVDDPAE